ncbi:hypothetical protein EXS70_02720 [Candidatus Peribacteria bacterium]|nr:hypothetical protein [Candidatus Peribacteria bacterium]
MKHDNSSPSAASSERLLRSVRARITPKAGAQDRVRAMLRSEMRAAHMLNQVRESLQPAPGLAARLWSAILGSVDPIRHLSLWERLRGSITPTESASSALWNRLSLRLEPAYAHAAVSRPVKWVAAFAVLLIAVRVSPFLFLAPASIASSSVTLFPTRGNVEVLIGSLWQPMTGEVTLNSPMRLQTQEGQATVTIHDDAVFRFAENTRGQILDLSNRPESSSQETTVALEDGEMWVRGFVPKNVRGITVITAQGRIVIHEGSVSIRQSGDEVVVRVFDRSAIVSRHGHQLSLVTGEQVVLFNSDNLVGTAMDPSVFRDAWVAANLTRDAAHQREIAQLQQERLAASAGILPGTTFYRVKRLAESVDVLFSLSEEERTRKLITQANTRLNEAAALLPEGRPADVQNALQQYKETVLQVASGSGGSEVVQSLLQSEVVDAGSATVGAALPGDPSYALKQAVDDTIASLPGDKMVLPDVGGEALLDELYAVKRQASEGDMELAKQKLSELTESIASLNTTGALSLVSADVRAEAKAVVQQVEAVVDGPTVGTSLSLGVPPKDLIVPEHPARTGFLHPMKPEQVTAKAQEIRGRIFLFSKKKAQYSVLDDQLVLLVRYPDRGSILRELSSVLPRNGLSQRVMREIQLLQKEVEKKVATASGGVAQ